MQLAFLQTENPTFYLDGSSPRIPIDMVCVYGPNGAPAMTLDNFHGDLKSCIPFVSVLNNKGYTEMTK